LRYELGEWKVNSLGPMRFLWLETLSRIVGTQGDIAFINVLNNVYVMVSGTKWSRIHLPEYGL
jgi:hypothetical protein